MLGMKVKHVGQIYLLGGKLVTSSVIRVKLRSGSD